MFGILFVLALYFKTYIWYNIRSEVASAGIWVHRWLPNQATEGNVRGLLTAGVVQ